jgi:nucleoside-diphosphate-sugar epimerase
MKGMITDRRPRILVTGASSGVGLATAEPLAAGGAGVITVSRDPSRGVAASERVAALATGSEPVFLPADPSNQSSIRDLSALLHLSSSAAPAAASVWPTHLVFDFAVGCADGAHRQHHLGIAPPAARLRQSGGERGYNLFSAYARSKLATVLFTCELAGSALPW